MEVIDSFSSDCIRGLEKFKPGNPTFFLLNWSQNKSIYYAMSSKQTTLKAIKTNLK